MITLAKPLDREYEVHYFFSFYHIGGAEKVHAQIVQATSHKKGVIWFTKRSHNDLFYKTFEKSDCRIIDISRYTDNKRLYFLNCICRGIISGYINKQQSIPIVFNGQCNFGYKISPWIKKQVPQAELIHSFNTFSHIRIPFIPFYQETIMISQVRIADHYAQYDKLHVPAAWKARIKYIPNGIEIPTVTLKDYSKQVLNLLYVGRGTPEKRVHLVGSIAKACHSKGLKVAFTILGDVKEAMPAQYQPFCNFLGNLNDESKIDQVYADSDILLITSSTEGFPLVIMEGMAHGLVIISTAVGDVPLHIKDGENGLVITEINVEAAIVEKAVRFINQIEKDRVLFWKMNEANRKYAEEHFAIGQFNSSWQQLFNRLKTSH